MNIKERCTNPNCPDYKYYGERGIQMFGPWQKDPQAFIDYIQAMPRIESLGWTIDRKDNNDHYKPGNLRWATMFTQNRNRRIKRKDLTSL